MDGSVNGYYKLLTVAKMARIPRATLQRWIMDGIVSSDKRTDGPCKNPIHLFTKKTVKKVIYMKMLEQSGIIDLTARKDILKRIDFEAKGRQCLKMSDYHWIEVNPPEIKKEINRRMNEAFVCKTMEA